jgi:hypothetical protein
LWDDTVKLQCLVNGFAKSRAEQVRQQRMDEIEVQGREAFSAGNYKEVVELYGQIGNSLSPTQRKRLEIAQKRLRDRIE